MVEIIIPRIHRNIESIAKNADFFDVMYDLSMDSKKTIFHKIVPGNLSRIPDPQMTKESYSQILRRTNSSGVIQVLWHIKQGISYGSYGRLDEVEHMAWILAPATPQNYELLAETYKRIIGTDLTSQF